MADVIVCPCGRLLVWKEVYDEVENLFSESPATVRRTYQELVHKDDESTPKCSVRVMTEENYLRWKSEESRLLEEKRYEIE